MQERQLTNKLYSIVIAAVATLLTVALVSGRGLMVRGFEGIEDDAARQGLARARAAADAELAELAASVRTLAARNDAHRLLQPPADPSVAAGLIPPEVLGALRLDVIWFVDAAGLERLCFTRASADGTAPVTLPRRLIAAPPGGAASPAHFARIAGQPAEVASVAVPHPDRPGAIAGQFVVVRFIGPATVERWSAVSGLSVSVTALAPHGTLASRLPPAASDGPSSSAALARGLVVTSSDNEIAGYEYLRDAGEPVAVLGIRMPRAILAAGRRTTDLLTLLFFGVVISFAAIAMLLYRLLDRSHRAREVSERRYHTVIEQLDDCVALADSASGRMLEVNPAMMRRLGLTAAEIRTLHVEELFVGLPESWRSGQSVTEERTEAYECRMRARDGRLIDSEVTFSALSMDGVSLTCLVARDVTARKQAEKELLDNQRKLAHLAHHDPLTGLPNRLHLQARLPRMLAEAEQSGRGLALLYLDVDQFKHINDARGHGSGDRLLASLADRLSRCVSPEDLIVRMGGDEFVVVATGRQDHAGVDSLARLISDTLRAPVDFEGHTEAVTVSIGISIFPQDGRDGEILLKHADIALYQAKDLGRNNHQFFAPAMNARLSERVALEQALRHALGTEQLFLQFQPIVDLKTGWISGLEALLRWQHPELGLVPPTRFIPVAEQCGVIPEVGEHVIRQVCRQLHDWSAKFLPLVPVSINVSPKQFERGRLAETVSEVTAEFGVDPSLLNFEITESAVMQNTEQHVGTLTSLRAAGCRISIDDFGTGYSSLSYLKHLPIDTLKIDRAFVRDMATDANDAAIVSAIVGMARTLGLSTVAEGVENKEQLRRLRELGCDSAQGYYFSRPISARDCAALLDNLGRSSRAGDTVRLRALTVVANG